MNRQKQFQAMADKLRGMFPLSDVEVWRDMVVVHVPGHEYTLEHTSDCWILACDDSDIVRSRFPLRPMTELQKNLREIYSDRG
jgi:hypothetical protein